MSFFPLNDTLYEAKDLRAWFIGRTSGIINYTGDDYGVTPAGGMNVSLKPGAAYVQAGTEEPGGGIALDPKSTPFIVEIADDFIRYDYICIEYNSVSNEGKPKYYKGNYNMPNPVRNSTTFQLIVAVIRVKAYASSISGDDIIDTRMNEKYCGLAVDTLARIPTDSYDRQFRAFMQNVQDVLDGNTAGNLLNLINQKQNKIDSGFGEPFGGEDDDIWLEL